MADVEDYFTATDGARLFTRRWHAAGEARAAVVIVHGYGHHSGSFEQVAQRLASAGYAVFAYDQRGIGSSPGSRGVITSLYTFIDDLDRYLAEVDESIGDVPVYILGHSFGSLLAANYLITCTPEIDGMISSSGLLSIPDHVSPWLVRLGNIISTIAPFAPIERLDVTAISRDQDVVTAALADEGCYYGTINARTAGCMSRGIQYLNDHLDAFNVPILLVHGTGDRLTPHAGSQRVYEGVSSPDKTLELFEGGYHELFNDLDKERFYDCVIGWLNERTAP